MLERNDGADQPVVFSSESWDEAVEEFDSLAVGLPLADVSGWDGNDEAWGDVGRYVLGLMEYEKDDPDSAEWADFYKATGWFYLD